MLDAVLFDLNRTLAMPHRSLRHAEYFAVQEGDPRRPFPAASAPRAACAGLLGEDFGVGAERMVPRLRRSVCPVFSIWFGPRLSRNVDAFEQHPGAARHARRLAADLASGIVAEQWRASPIRSSQPSNSPRAHLRGQRRRPRRRPRRRSNRSSCCAMLRYAPQRSLYVGDVQRRRHRRTGRGTLNRTVSSRFPWKQWSPAYLGCPTVLRPSQRHRHLPVHLQACRVSRFRSRPARPGRSASDSFDPHRSTSASRYDPAQPGSQRQRKGMAAVDSRIDSPLPLPAPLFQRRHAMRVGFRQPPQRRFIRTMNSAGKLPRIQLPRTQQKHQILATFLASPASKLSFHAISRSRSSLLAESRGRRFSDRRTSVIAGGARQRQRGQRSMIHSDPKVIAARRLVEGHQTSL